MEPTILAAIISATVAVIGVVVSIVTSRWSIKLHNKEVDLKSKELDASIQRLGHDVESVRQSQFSETLSRRADGYPKLWSTIREFTTNWDDEKPKDLQWLKDFLNALNKVDTEYGVFFSQAVYERFHELQYLLHNLKKQYAPNTEISLKDLEKIDVIFRGRSGVPGLAAYLKDDLGSYREISIQTRSANPEPNSMVKSLENKESSDDLSDVFYSSTPCFGPSIDYEQILSLRQDWLAAANSVLLTPTSGMTAAISILESQSGFKRIADETEKFIVTKILRQPNKEIALTDSLLNSGMIDDFSLMDLALFVEDNFGVRIEDTELSTSTFDTLLELTALVYKRKNK